MAEAGYTMSTLDQFVGRELGVSAWQEVTQDMINAFADCTGDHQWIHVDVDRARRESPFGGPVAHGFLTLSLLAAMGEALGIVPADAKAAINYGIDKLRFLAPVPAGSRVRCRVSLMKVEDRGQGRSLLTVSNTVELEGSSRPALTAESLVMAVAQA